MKKRVIVIVLAASLLLLLGCPGDDDGAGAYDCPYCKDTGKIVVKNCCNTCGGEGKTWIPIPPAQVTRDKKRYWGTCPDCGGTGGWWKETIDCPWCTK